MSRGSVLGAFLYEVESGWAEATSTFTNRLQTLDALDVSGLMLARAQSLHTTQYAGEYAKPIPTVFGGSFRTRHYLCGHGSTTAGAVTAEEHETLLGYAIGNTLTTGTGGTFTGGTAAIPTTTAASGFAAGGIGFAGAKGDSGGDGQAFVTGTHAGNSLTLLGALPAAPNNADVCYSAMNVYPTETPSSQSVSSIRARILTGNLQYDCHGCFPMSLTIGQTNPAELPWYEIEWGVSRFTYANATFPTATAADSFQPAPMAGGSVFLQMNGTTTRATYAARQTSITINLGIQPIRAPGGIAAQQVIVGAERTKHTVQAEFVVASGSATTTPTWSGRYDTNDRWQVLVSFNGAATGKRVAFYMPNANLDGDRPEQFSLDGINCERIRFQSNTGGTTTSELTLSSYRFGFG